MPDNQVTQFINANSVEFEEWQLVRDGKVFARAQDVQLAFRSLGWFVVCQGSYTLDNGQAVSYAEAKQVVLGAITFLCAAFAFMIHYQVLGINPASAQLAKLMNLIATPVTSKELTTEVKEFLERTNLHGA